ncbi:hypothetical protein U1Q18_016290 [Sarracenia purpurea var. burkii]
MAIGFPLLGAVAVGELGAVPWCDAVGGCRLSIDAMQLLIWCWLVAGLPLFGAVAAVVAVTAS